MVTTTAERKAKAKEETAEVEVDVDRLQEKAEHLAAIERKNVEVRAKKQEYLKRKDGALKAKKDWDECNQELLELITEGTDPQRKLPGMRAAELQQSKHAGNGQAKPAEDDSWKRVSVTEGVGARGKMLKLLEEAGIKTMGDFVAADAEGRIQNIKGIGPKKYDQFKDAMVDFLQRERDSKALASGKPKQIKLKATGTIYDVTKWQGERAVVTHRGRLKVLGPEDFEAVA
jgi:DNA polymerase/3'-5' exonuclease PolX